MKSMGAQNRFDDEGSAAVADFCPFPPSSPREKYSDKRQAALAQRLFVVARVQKKLEHMAKQREHITSGNGEAVLGV